MGEVYVADQTVSFLLSIGLGAVCCLLYDIVRIIHFFRVKKWLSTFIIDILYFVIVSFLTYCFLFFRCVGQVRLFVLIGQLFGFVICRNTLSVIFMKIWMFILKKVGKFLRFTKKICRRIFNMIEKELKKGLILLKKIISAVKKYLKQSSVVVYNHFVKRQNN